MTTLNAFGFFLLGLMMAILPVIASAYFPGNSLDGSNTSALWLEVMGVFQGSMGTFFIFRNEAAPFAVRLMTMRFPTFKPADRRTTAPGFLLQPVEGDYLPGQSGENQQLAA